MLEKYLVVLKVLWTAVSMDVVITIVDMQRVNKYVKWMQRVNKAVKWLYFQ